MFLVIIAGFSTPLSAQKHSVSQDIKMEWWREARFGMFIHWGVYAVPAGVYKGHEQRRGPAEWIMNRMKIPVADYKQFAKQFNPVKFDADAWVKMAKDAGMKYIVITAKHHDGFAMFKTEASKWNIVDATPYGEDVIKKLSEACEKEGIRLGLYYSQAQDWVNPGGAAARRLATDGWLTPDSAMIDAYTKEYNGHWDVQQMTVTMGQYIDKVAVPQVKELLTNYGDISVIFWDTPENMTDEFAEKLQTILELQPNIISNDRLKHPNFKGDYKTPEQKIPDLNEINGEDWETCMTMNNSWGYRSSDNNWKSSKVLIQNLIEIVSKGGNYLLNVGPKANGEFPQESIDRLREIGFWMKKNGEAIYGTQASPFKELEFGYCTKKETKDKTVIYLFVLDWPTDRMLLVPELKNRVLSAKILSNGKTVKTATKTEGLMINVPTKAPDEITTVIKIELKGQVENYISKEQKSKMKTGALD